jgi:hypothetical protein
LWDEGLAKSRKAGSSQGGVRRKRGVPQGGMRADGQKPDMRRERRASGPVVAKPISIKDAERRFGGGARKAVELTSGDLLGLPAGRD